MTSFGLIEKNMELSHIYLTVQYSFRLNLQLQFLGYNADLYDNYTSASWHPNGLVGLSVLVQIGQMSNIELRKITDAAASVPYRGKF
jgi:hypothetical protein